MLGEKKVFVKLGGEDGVETTPPSSNKAMEWVDELNTMESVLLPADKPTTELVKIFLTKRLLRAQAKLHLYINISKQDVWL